MGSSADSDRPDWWEANERLREEMELPPYEPPRFIDGVYTHEIVPDLEEEHDCIIMFAGIDPEYPEDWYVRVDGEGVMSIGRHRDENGNTIYEMTADEFVERLEAELREL
jgi:hypothetical protein